MNFYLDLFLSYLKIGLFSIGGGRAAIPVVQSIVVDEKSWLTMREFTDVITISEMTPGPFGLNSATFIGAKLGGIWGGVLSTFACMVAPLVIVVLISFLYMRFRKLTVAQGVLTGVRPAVVGLLASAALAIILLSLFDAAKPDAQSAFNLTAFTIAVFATFILRKFKLNSVLVIFFAGISGVIMYGLQAL
jgi:chromate transporter